MKAIESGLLPLYELLRATAKKAHVLDGLSNVSLLSIGHLCDDDCITVFDKRNLRVYKQGQLVLKGVRKWTNGLWDVIFKPQQHHANIIIHKD